MVIRDGDWIRHDDCLTRDIPKVLGRLESLDPTFFKTGKTGRINRLTCDLL